MTSAKKLNTSEEVATYIVGVGASAGGLGALQTFVTHLPLKSKMGFVIAQHLSPQHRSMMAELLARQTKLNVVEAQHHSSVLLFNTVYITPPNKDIYFKDGRLRLRSPQAEIGPKPSVDYFFSSLADELQDKSVGIIFSGTGSDGTHGMRAIKAVGGTTIAQKPNTAKYDSMPQAVIRAGVADFILPPKDIAEQLIAILSAPKLIASAKDDEAEQLPSYQELMNQLYHRTQVDFSEYKEGTLSRQIERRLIALQLKTLETYLEYIEQQPEELDKLLKSFLISVTSFFRDKDYFNALRQLLRNTLRDKSHEQRLRIWVPGCATGEEAYSIVILVAEELGRKLSGFDLKIFATDLDAEATEQARRGLYPETALVGLDDSLIERYFRRQGRNYQINKPLRELIVFARHDLTQDPPFLKLDLISCRNLLIYFKPELQNKVISIFHYALVEGGYLFLGKSESLGQQTRLFSVIDSKHKIYRRKAGNASLRLAKVQLPKLKVTPPVAKLNRPDPAMMALIESYAPASVLVNQEGEALRLFGNITPFLSVPQGTATLHLPAIVLPALRTEIWALLHRARNRAEIAAGHYQDVMIRGQMSRLHIIVRPIDSIDTQEQTYLISFEQQSIRIPKENQDQALSAPGLTLAQQRIDDLEQELAQTKAHLQAVIEEMGSSNEELQSLNEELQASGEELQSSNEELETTNEELQATNEELTTINEELQVKSAELSESNATLENLQESLSLALVVVDTELRLVRFTPEAVRIFGILASDIGRSITALPTHVKLGALKQKITKVIKTGRMSRERILGKDTTYLMQVNPYRDGFGHISGAVLTFTDIRELQQALDANERLADELQTALNFRQALLNSAPYGIYAIDLNNIIQVFSYSAEKLLGYKAEDVIGKVPLQQFHDPDEFEERIRSVAANTAKQIQTPLDWLLELSHIADMQEYEWTMVRKDGSRFPGLLTLSVLTNSAGERTGFIGIVQDLTERKKVQDTLQASVVRYGEIYQYTPVMLHSIDHQGRLVNVSDYWLRVMGYERQEVIGRRSSEFLTEDSRQFAQQTVLPEFWRTGVCSNIPYQFVKKNGDIIDVELSAVALKTNSNETHSVAVIIDVTARKQAEHELVARNKELADYAHVISHDLQAPLRQMVIFADFLSDELGESLTDQVEHYLNRMTSSAYQMQKLVRDLLDLAETGHAELTLSVFALDECLDQVLETLRVQIESSGASIQRDCMPMIRADRTLLTQVYQNLMTNALKFIATGSRPHIQLTAELHRHQMIFGVKDDGIGMKPKHTAQIFEPFKRLHSVQKYEGTGIGLAICQKIIHLHGGTLWVESALGEGAHFKVYFTQ